MLVLHLVSAIESTHRFALDNQANKSFLYPQSSTAQSTGPALSGTLVELIGFEGLIITTALICFAFAPLLLLLRNPPARQVDEAQLQEQSSLRYVNYNQLDSPDEEAQLTGYTKSNPTYVR